MLLVDLDSQGQPDGLVLHPDEWANELLPQRTIKHWFDGIGTPDERGEPARADQLPAAGARQARARPGSARLIAAHRDIADIETRLAAELLHDPSHFGALHGRLRAGLAHKDLADYDTVLIDCAPNFGLVAKNAVAAATMLLIPTKPDYLSTNGIDSLGLKIREFTEEFNASGSEPIDRPPAAVIFTMVQNHDGEPIEAQRSVISRIEARQVPTFETTMRDSKAVYGPAPEHGVPVILAGTGRAATRELREMVSELTGRLDGLHGLAA